jgi:hypothetical protein
MNKHYLIRPITIFILSTLLSISIFSQVKSAYTRDIHQHLRKLIKNACVTKDAMDNMYFCFKDGKYIDGPIEIILLEPIISTHFNSNSSEYVIAPMSYYGGGNGKGSVFYLLLVFIYHNNEIKQVAWGDILMDGVPKGIKINNDTIIVDLSYGDTINSERFLYHKNHLSNLDEK